jgi:hypothetical protein
MGQEWHCEAYGAKGAEIGATCFAGDAEGVRCVSARACHETMQRERYRVFDKLLDLANSGDEDAQYLAEHFKSPDQLLNGDPEPPETPTVADSMARCVNRPGEVSDSGGSGPGIRDPRGRSRNLFG